MAISNVKIANMALVELGEQRIYNLTDSTNAAILCNLVFDRVRDEVLRKHEWNFAIERQELAALEESPITEDWEYQYQLPVDPKCLRVLDMPDAPDALWVKEGDYLLTNENPVIIRYIKRVTDPAYFDSLFIKAFAYRLAADIALSLTDDIQKKTLMEGLYDKAIMEAKDLDVEDSQQANSSPTKWNEVER